MRVVKPLLRGSSLALVAIILLLTVSIVFATEGDSYWGLLRIGGEQDSDEWVGRSGVADSDLFIGGPTAAVATDSAVGATFDGAELHGRVTYAVVIVDERGFDWDTDSGAPYTYEWYRGQK